MKLSLVVVIASVLVLLSWLSVSPTTKLVTPVVSLSRKHVGSVEESYAPLLSLRRCRFRASGGRRRKNKKMYQRLIARRQGKMRRILIEYYQEYGSVPGQGMCARIIGGERKSWKFSRDDKYERRMWLVAQERQSRRLRRSGKLRRQVKRLLSIKLNMLSDACYEQMKEEEAADVLQQESPLFVLAGGKTYVIEINLMSATVLNLKEKIAEHVSIPVTSFWLSHGTSGKPFRENLTLQDYAVQTDDTVHVNIRGCGGDAVQIRPPFLQDLPSQEEVQERVNRRYDNLYQKRSDGSLKPLVCTVCDEFLIEEDNIEVLPPSRLYKNRDHFQWQKYATAQRCFPVEEEYKFDSTLLSDLKPPKGLSDNSWVEELALSPRGTIINNRNGTSARARSVKGFSCCKNCYNKLTNNDILPFYSIINRNFYGHPPAELTDLTEEEKAFLTPVRSHGFCITYSGGRQLNLKGTLVFLRVEERRIAQAAVQMDVLGLQNHVVVVATGPLTAAQKEKVVKRSEVRPEKILAAVRWLKKNHPNWQKIDLDQVEQEIRSVQPKFVDASHLVDSVDSNIEEQEAFSCYFPDGTTTNESGGYDDAHEFKEQLEKIKSLNCGIELRCNFEKEFVNGAKSDEFINSCLLQFPYGIGGMSERREKTDGSFQQNVEITGYLRHLSRVSIPTFQTPLFQLILYSMKCKDSILKSSTFTLKGSHDASDIAKGLNINDLNSTIRQRRRGNRYGGTAVSNKLLNAVDASSAYLPHTDDATKKARGKGEALQHHFGTGSVFLTVTFDDENSLIMQVLHGDIIDDGTDVSSMSDEEVKKRRKARKQLRLKFPGIATTNFEMLLDIIVSEVVGWNMSTNEPTEKPGFFGKCTGLSFAVEEQGRKTLHAHMTVWIDGYQRVLDEAMFGVNKSTRSGARNTVAQYYDHMSSTELFAGIKASTMAYTLKHECVNKQSSTACPVLVSDQQLRDLRHKHGYDVTEGRIAYCPDCNKSFTYEEMVAALMVRSEPLVPPCMPIDCKTDIPLDRMFQTVVNYQRSIPGTPVPSRIINATYQHHASCHVKGCFKCSSKKRSHQCSPKCECRYRLPDRKRRKTELKEHAEAKPWFDWTGEERLVKNHEYLPKRGGYDVCQNVSCSAISTSKATCNTNVKPITPGPLSQYQYKYNFKKTQDQETADYEEVSKAMERALARESEHDNDRSQALSYICTAAFAHAKRNVISASMAAYLTRHGSRFYFSHQTVFCPLSELSRCLQRRRVGGTLKFNYQGKSYIENQALHYLCRGRELEEYSVMDFYENFESCDFTAKEAKSKKVDYYPFLADTGYFRHPSWYNAQNGKILTTRCSQAMKEREQPVLLRVSQWCFPDSATFEANMLHCSNNEMTEEMNEYARLVLILFLPHRCDDDLAVTGQAFPYLKKLREVYAADRNRQNPLVFTTRHLTFLQNVQDCRWNCLRYEQEPDDLAMDTDPFDMKRVDPDYVPKFDDDDDKEDEEDAARATYEELITRIAATTIGSTSTLGHSGPYTPHSMDFSVLRDNGRKGCGYEEAYVPDCTSASSDFVTVTPLQGTPNPSTSGPVGATGVTHKSTSQIISWLMTRTTARARSDLFRDPNVEVQPANGSITSILQWSSAAGLDSVQRRAFECIVSSFLLTFYDNAEKEDLGSPTVSERSKFRRTKGFLRMLMGNNKEQLICLLHGPGGSGKSTVINLVKAYAKAYCEGIGHPYTPRTITVTAMSGVAATLLQGETTHSALGLNKKTDPTQEDRLDFEDTRLLVIDEISFASTRDIKKIEARLRLLGSKYQKYGGFNIVFAGDYCQLEPVKGDPIYNDCIPQFDAFLNCFIELNGKHRFRTDPQWGALLARIRDGCPTKADIDFINDRCLISKRSDQPPPGIQVATYRNKERDAINTAVFERYCQENNPGNGEVLEGAIVVLMDHLEMSNGKKTYSPVTDPTVKKYFYENCGESDCQFDTSKYIDPALKLYPNCPLMLLQNKDVRNGQANGSRLRLKQVLLKIGEQPFITEVAGVKVRVVYASQVDALCLEHENENIRPRCFNMKPDEISFKAKIRTQFEFNESSMKGIQFPVVSNSATTGHKLQGCTVKNILVNEWFYGNNWAYVVLSRVTTMDGLFLRQPLQYKEKHFAKSEEMEEMLDDFRRRKTTTSPPVSLLDAIVHEEEK